MPVMKALFAKLFGAGANLSLVEKMVLDCVKSRLDARLAVAWDKQVQAINKIQRLPEGTEVNFYRMRNGRPSFDDALTFPNRSEELLIAKVQLELPNMGTLRAKVWCIKGFLFSIEYAGSVSYFDEALGMSPQPELRLACEMTADLSAVVGAAAA